MSEKLNIQNWEFVKSQSTIDKFLQFQTLTKNYGFNPQEIILTFMKREKKFMDKRTAGCHLKPGKVSEQFSAIMIIS